MLNSMSITVQACAKDLYKTLLGFRIAEEKPRQAQYFKNTDRETDRNFKIRIKKKKEKHLKKN